MFKKYVKISLPMILSCNFMLLPSLVNVFYAGRFNDPAKLAAIGLGNATMNIMCLSFIIGLNGVLETLVSQAFGARNLFLCGVYLNRARFIVTATYLPLATIILLFAKTFLIKLGLDPMTIHYVFKYIRPSLVGYYFIALFDIQKRWLNCMQVTTVPMVA